MSDGKEFVTAVTSDARKTPLRIAFVTRRTSAHVKAYEEAKVQSFPEVLFRAAIVVEVLAIALVLISLFFNAPLEGLADPSHTPNPAKAPWYFLGLQELLHYFPPMVAGVLVPTLVVMALIVIPYFNVNVDAAGLFTKDRQKRLRIFWVVSALFCIFLVVFDVYRGAGSNADHGGTDGAGGGNATGFGLKFPAVAGRETAFLLDHDVVPV